jgi:membrane protein implicated in regulation of membrane protease activity
MKGLKSADFFLQISLLALLVIALLISNAETINPMFFLLGFAIVQLISIIAHAAAGTKSWKMAKWRKIHHIGMLLVFALLFIALLQGSGGRSGDKDDKYSMEGLGTVLFAVVPAVALAAFYLIITWKEWLNSRKRN